VRLEKSGSLYPGEWGWADRGKHRFQKGFAVNSNTVGLVLGT